MVANKSKKGSSKQSASVKVNNLNYRQTAVIKENTATSIYGINVNEKFSRPNEPLFLAAVGGRFVWFYKLLAEGETILMGSFEDRDQEEDFYCCDWSYFVPAQNRSKGYEERGETHDCGGAQHVVACAGKKGVVRILAPNVAQSIVDLEGHGEAVNEVKFHPRQPDLLVTFSKDYTVRLWNMWSSMLVCVFGGCEGHRSEILHGDVDMTGKWLVSCGMDHAIKIWRLDEPRITNAISESRKPRTNDSRAFPTYLQHFPVFSSTKIHKNYVDCGRWFGQMVLSKSCDGFMSLWKPGSLDSSLDLRFKIGQETKESIVHQFELSGAEIWYIRFDIDAEKGLVAWGNRQGQIYIWDIRQGQVSENSVFDIEPIILNVSIGSRGMSASTNTETESAVPDGSVSVAGAAVSQQQNIVSSNLIIRQTRFTNNARTLLCSCDQGVIVRFDLVGQ